MLEILNVIKSFVRFTSRKVCIDNRIFQLHYMLSVMILLGSALFVSSNTYFRQPIRCMGSNSINPRILNSYCWIHSTFSVYSPRGVIRRDHKDSIYTGVAPFVKGNTVITHKYYQWVPYVLIFQAFCFHLPRYLWKILEGGRMKMLVLEMDTPVINEALRTTQASLLARYIMDNLNKHTFYLMRFIVCELLNLTNVIGQIYLLSVFLGNEFITYGLDVLGFSDRDLERRTDPMARMFPTMAKCSFNKFGASGSLQTFDGLCVLTQNIINEKIYVFLWFWFWFVAIASVLNTIYRISVIMSTRMRIALLRTRTNLYNLQVTDDQASTVCSRLGFADWFVMYQVGKNIDGVLYRDFVINLCEQLECADDTVGLTVLKSE